MHWPKGGWKNTNNHGSGRDMKSQSKCHLIRGLSLEGGPDERGPMPGQGLSKQEIQKQKAPTKSGMTGLAYLHSMGGMAPGGGGGTPPPGKGGPPDDKEEMD